MKTEYKKCFNCDIPVPDLPDAPNGTFIVPKRGKPKVNRLVNGFKVLVLGGRPVGEKYAGGGSDGTLSIEEDDEVRLPAAICFVVD